MKWGFFRCSIKLCLVSMCISSAPAARIEWTNVLGGNWDAPSNWNPNQVPAAIDEAVITAAGSYSVALESSAGVASLSLGGPDGGQALLVSGSLSVAEESSINVNGLMSLFGGTVGGAGNIVVEGTFNVFGGSLAGSGVLVVGGSGHLLLGGNINMGGKGIQNSGKATWTSGNILNISYLTVSTNSVFDILVPGDNTLSGAQGLTNRGVMRRSVGNGSAIFDVPLRNEATIEVHTGRFVLMRGASQTGNLTLASNAALQIGLFGNHVYEFLDGSSILGGGHVSFQSGMVTNQGTFNIAGMTTMNGGTITLSGGYMLSNSPLTINAGTVNFDSGRMLYPSTLTLNGGILAGGDSMTVTGLVALNGGILQSGGAINADGGMGIATSQPAEVTVYQGTLNNAGLATMRGSLRLWSNSVLNNLPAATFHYAQGFFGQPGVPGRFNNAGLLRKTGTFGGIAIPFYNDGVVDVESGILFFSEGGIHSGLFNVASNATMRFDPGLFGAAHTLLSTSQIRGAGNLSFQTSVNAGGLVGVSGAVVVTGGTNNFTGVYTNARTLNVTGGRANFDTGKSLRTESLTVSGGMLAGSDAMVVSGSMTWTGGVLGGSGSINAKGVLTIAGSTLLIQGRTLYNSGVAHWNGGFIFSGDGSTINNLPSGVFNIAFDAQTFAGFGGTRTWANAGVLRKSAGIGTAVIRDAVQNTGTIEVQSGRLAFENSFVQTAGAMVLNGGDIAANGLLQIRGGVLTGAGTVAADVLNSGHVSPGRSAGVLRIIGNYMQTSGGALGIELGGTEPGTAFDQVQISGTASLDGVMNVSTISGFRPALGDAFRVLTFGSRTGDFVTMVDNTGTGMNRSYDSSSLTLVATNSPPFLVISREGPNIAVTWPTNLSGYILQSATNLPATSWDTIPSSESNTFILSPTQLKTFFRLVKP